MSGSASASPRPAAPNRIWTTLDLLKWTKDFFARKGLESPRLESELLLAGAVGCDRIQLYTDFEKPLDAETLARYREWVRRRGEQREPLAYILGHAPFIELTLDVSPAVLIPRPETEELALWARSVLDARRDLPDLRALDIGTGSGCLALALAHHVPQLHVMAVDLSRDALEIARRNASTHGLQDRVQFAESDVYAALPVEAHGTFDLIVANPPYINPCLKETLQPEVRLHEPAEALFADDQGQAVSARIIQDAAAWLKPGGWLGLEISPEQAPGLCVRLQSTGAFGEVEVRKDVRQVERFLLAERRR